MNDDTACADQLSCPAASVGVGLSIVDPGLSRRRNDRSAGRGAVGLAPAGGLEIVLVNDGSPDNSGESAATWCGVAACRSPMSSTRAISASTTRS